MNLVAKEYVAVKQDNPGVLVLGEMAGAAVELTDALLVNPNDTEQIENAICRALKCRLKNSKNGCTVCSLLYPYRLSINGHADFVNEWQEVGTKTKPCFLRK